MSRDRLTQIQFMRFDCFDSGMQEKFDSTHCTTSFFSVCTGCSQASQTLGECCHYATIKAVSVSCVRIGCKDDSTVNQELKKKCPRRSPLRGDVLGTSGDIPGVLGNHPLGVGSWARTQEKSQESPSGGGILGTSGMSLVVPRMSPRRGDVLGRTFGCSWLIVLVSQFNKD